MKYETVTIDLRSDNSTHALLLRAVPRGASVLEFGPASGYMTRYMQQELGCVVTCVEIDQESAELAGRYAREVLVGDIDTAFWVPRLLAQTFDVVVFADVLEHLRNPGQALSQAVGLLKPGGIVLTSIPNIAHNAIILGLLAGQFRYTSTGLLDDSHIRFFTRESILAMLDKAGLFPVSWQATFLEPAATELRQSYIGLPEEVAKFLAGRDDRHVYQYVTVSRRIQDLPADEKNAAAGGPRPAPPAPLQEPQQDAAYTVQLFWDTGADFIPAAGLTGSSRPDNQTRRIEFSLPRLPIRRLRLDPTSFPGYVRIADSVVTDFAAGLAHPICWQALAGVTELTDQSSQGAQEFLCHDSDPQLVSGDDLPAWVGGGSAKLTFTLRASQNMLEFQTQLKKIVAEMQHSRECIPKLQGQIEALATTQQNLHEQVEQLQCEIAESAEAKQQLQDQLAQLQREKQEMVAARRALQAELQEQIEQQRQQQELQQDELQLQLAKSQRQCEEFRSVLQNMQTSKSWRLTQPVRQTGEAVKRGRLFGHRLLTALRRTNRFVFVDRKLSLKPTALHSQLKKFLRIVRNRQEILPEQLTPTECQSQKTQHFPYQPLLSLITPTYNTKAAFLEELVASLRKQTYPRWELCIADGASNAATVACLKKWQAIEPRIKLTCLPANLGIAGNTIKAYELSSGDYVILLDHDDYLTEDALYEIVKSVNQYPDADFIYSDRAIFDDRTRELLAYHFLPGYSPEFLRACNYASHLNAFSRQIIDKVGFEREGFDGSQDYDIELRVAEAARRIVHIAKPLYFCRACEGSVALDPESKMYAYAAGKKAIEQHLHRIGQPGEVQFLKETFSYRIRYELKQHSKISILIPNKDHSADLQRCLDSILAKTTYQNFELVIIENNSQHPETFACYERLQQDRRLRDGRIRVLHYPRQGFNFSAINNWAAAQVDGEYLLLLNNDTEVIAANWLEEMLMFAQRDDVGAVGAKLYYPNDTIQHAGLLIGLGGHIAAHYDHGKSRFETGYMHRLTMPQNYCAVTAACLMVKKTDYALVEGLDEVNFAVGLNDVDFCLKLRELGKVNVVTPYAELYHHESLSRGLDESGPALERYNREAAYFRQKWEPYYTNGDPYHNPYLR